MIEVPDLDVLEKYADATMLAALRRTYDIIADENDELAIKAINAAASIARYVEGKRQGQMENTNPIEIDDNDLKVT